MAAAMVPVKPIEDKFLEISSKPHSEGRWSYDYQNIFLKSVKLGLTKK